MFGRKNPPEGSHDYSKIAQKLVDGGHVSNNDIGRAARHLNLNQDELANLVYQIQSGEPTKRSQGLLDRLADLVGFGDNSSDKPAKTQQTTTPQMEYKSPGQLRREAAAAREQKQREATAAVALTQLGTKPGKTRGTYREGVVPPEDVNQVFNGQKPTHTSAQTGIGAGRGYQGTGQQSVHAADYGFFDVDGVTSSASGTQRRNTQQSGGAQSRRSQSMHPADYGFDKKGR